MDTLSDVLSAIKFESALYGLIECGAPWGIQIPAADGHVRLLMVVQGNCLLRVTDTGQTLKLAEGELLLSRNYGTLDLLDAPDSAILPVGEACGTVPMRGQPVRIGGDGPVTSVMIGCFTLTAEQRNPFVASLPEVIHLQSHQVQSEAGLSALFRLLSSEITGTGPGGDILVMKLADIIFVQVVRAYVSQVKSCTETPGWLRAIGDPDIGAALNLIHANPSADWTVGTLAEKVNMSRTSFATKFAALVEKTPIDYLTSWRMQRALLLLQSGHGDIEEIANSVGYTSRAAFAKAFKKEFGRTPGEFKALAG